MLFGFALRVLLFVIRIRRARAPSLQLPLAKVTGTVGAILSFFCTYVVKYVERRRRGGRRDIHNASNAHVSNNNNKKRDISPPTLSATHLLFNPPQQFFLYLFLMYSTPWRSSNRICCFLGRRFLFFQILAPFPSISCNGIKEKWWGIRRRRRYYSRKCYKRSVFLILSAGLARPPIRRWRASRYLHKRGYSVYQSEEKKTREKRGTLERLSRHHHHHHHSPDAHTHHADLREIRRRRRKKKRNEFQRMQTIFSVFFPSNSVPK